MKTTTKSLLLFAFFTLFICTAENSSASENKYDALTTKELSNLTIDELLSIDLDELITIADKIADISNNEANSAENIELPLVVLADLDFENLMAISDQITIKEESTDNYSTITLPFTVFAEINLKSLIILNESCTEYKANHPNLAQASTKVK